MVKQGPAFQFLFLLPLLRNDNYFISLEQLDGVLSCHVSAGEAVSLIFPLTAWCLQILDKKQSVSCPVFEIYEFWKICLSAFGDCWKVWMLIQLKVLRRRVLMLK